MSDLMDLADDVVYFEAAGLHGLAMLARYQHARSWTGEDTNPAILEYFDTLAKELLSTATTGIPLRDIIQKPELGLTRTSSGRPPIEANLKGIPNSLQQKILKKQKAFNAALFREKLVRLKIAPTKADTFTVEKFGYADESAIRALTRKYREEVQANLDADFIFAALKSPDLSRLISIDELLASLLHELDK